MPRLHICSLARVAETVRTTGARSLVTLINVDTLVARPAEIDPARHLFIGMSDIIEPLEGHILPAKAHVAELITFAKAWDRNEPLVIHCHAGVSRSTAAAFIIACVLRPSRQFQHERHAFITVRAAADVLDGRDHSAAALQHRIGDRHHPAVRRRRRRGAADRIGDLGLGA
ncbi:MAG: hypothetical protein NVSMB26_29410 [Beijerinckiaceae bacterium]